MKRYSILLLQITVAVILTTVMLGYLMVKHIGPLGIINFNLINQQMGHAVYISTLGSLNSLVAFLSYLSCSFLIITVITFIAETAAEIARHISCLIENHFSERRRA